MAGGALQTLMAAACVRVAAVRTSGGGGVTGGVFFFRFSSGAESEVLLPSSEAPEPSRLPVSPGREPQHACIGSSRGCQATPPLSRARFRASVLAGWQDDSTAANKRSGSSHAILNRYIQHITRRQPFLKKRGAAPAGPRTHLGATVGGPFVPTNTATTSGRQCDASHSSVSRGNISAELGTPLPRRGGSSSSLGT